MINTLIALSIAFAAGLVDAIAGGGGLIQLPGLMWLYPSLPIPTLLGINKLASCCGTVFSSLHFVRTLKINYIAFLPVLLGSFICSMLGAKLTAHLNNHVLKPIVFCLLLAMALYAFFNKNLGLVPKERNYTSKQLKLYSVLIGMTLGFYDGFFGPGTGSFLIFSFVGWLGFSFLQGSAHAKLCNLASNTAAVIYFAASGHIIYHLAILMAVFNVFGNIIGAKLAIKQGSRFVRLVFLVVVVAILLRLVLQI